MPATAHIDTWIFDLDNTIYPAESRLFEQVRARMTAYIQQHFTLDQTAARAMRHDLFLRYGTTMKGLVVEHGTDPRHFMDFVHDIDLSQLKYDAVLDAGLGALCGRKVIFTNGSNAHAMRILDAYGISQHFDFSYDIFSANLLPKPAIETYQDFMAKGKINPKNAAMIEDMAINLLPAYQMGATTFWLNHIDDAGDAGDYEKEAVDTAHIHYTARDLKHCLSTINTHSEGAT